MRPLLGYLVCSVVDQVEDDGRSVVGFSRTRTEERVDWYPQLAN